MTPLRVHLGREALVLRMQARREQLRAVLVPQELSGLDDGEHRFRVRAVDRAGNPDPSPASRKWTVDTLPPETTIEDGPTDVSHKPTATFTSRARPAQPSNAGSTATAGATAASVGARRTASTSCARGPKTGPATSIRPPRAGRGGSTFRRRRRSPPARAGRPLRRPRPSGSPPPTRRPSSSASSTTAAGRRCSLRQAYSGLPQGIAHVQGTGEGSARDARPLAGAEDMEGGHRRAEHDDHVGPEASTRPKSATFCSPPRRAEARSNAASTAAHGGPARPRRPTAG